jgi:RNA polymerase sigma-70 factor, ECF subfamily
MSGNKNHLSVVFRLGGKGVLMESSPRIGKEVIESCKGGDGRAFEEIVLFYQKRVFNTAYRILGNTEEAKELAQEVFVTVSGSIKALREVSKFDAWLKQIILNHCRNRWKYLKRRQYYNSDSLDDPIETEDGSRERPIERLSGGPDSLPEALYEKKMIQQMIQRGLLELQEGQRELIVLRDIEGYSYEEIGKILTLPEGTVKSRLHRARMDLKEILERFSH